MEKRQENGFSSDDLKLSYFLSSIFIRIKNNKGKINNLETEFC